MIRKFDFLNFAIILLFSFSANYYFGSIGVFPIDTFAFFDSAHFVNKGYLPIRDYWTSNGFLVDILQSLFFYFLGVNWNAYLFHSSLINSIFVIWTYKFLIDEGLNFKFSLFYSLSASLLLYPPVGVPFSDHHSIIFSLLSFYCIIAAYRKSSIKLLLLSILFIFIAFLCKQIPAAFFMIFISFYILFKAYVKKNYKWIFISLIFSFSLLLLFGLILTLTKIEIKNFIFQYIYFPMSIGGERSLNFEIKYYFLSFIKEFKFFSILIIFSIYQIFFTKNDSIKKNEFNEMITIFIIVVMILIFNQSLIKNQIIIYFVIPIFIGLLHREFSLKIYQKKNFFIWFFIVLNVSVTIKYHERFNIDRKFMDLEKIDKSSYVMGSEISKKLSGLKWFTAQGRNKLYTEVSLLKETIKYLKENNNKSVIITYYQFLNSEVDNDNYSPNRWYTKDGVSYPLKESKYHNYYINFYKKKLIEKKITKIFTIEPLNKDSFDFVFKDNCFRTTKINVILFEHNLANCFAN